MANPEHVRIVKEGTAAILHRRRDTGVLDLQGAQLSGLDLRGAALQLANLGGASLKGANLAGALLTSAELWEVDLSQANLDQSDLRWTHLTLAKLDGTSLRGTQLTGAELGMTSMQNADLTEANLRGSHFLGTKVTGSDFTRAVCVMTTFGGIDFRNVNGLESIDHHGPSIVDFHTLSKSQGNIPEIFLRGCGVPETLITLLPSLFGGTQFYSCFISYSHADKSFARQLHDRLQGRGIRCWLDEKQLLPGDNIYQAVEHGIRVWDKLLLCGSKDSLTSWWVDNEIVTALEKEQQLMKKHGKEVLALIPLNLDGFMFSDEWQGGYKQQVRKRLAADFQGWESSHEKFQEQLERLVRALQADGGKEIPPEPKLK